MIIGVVALARAGKDVFADYLVEKCGYKKVNTSDVLRDALVAEGREPTKDSMSILADGWRKEHGMDIVTRRSLESVMGYDGDVVLLGLRSPEEADLAKEVCSDGRFVLVAITAAREERYQRRTSIDPQDKESFFGRDERDIKNKGLDKALGKADYVLENNGTLQEFYSKIENFMGEVMP